MFGIKIKFERKPKVKKEGKKDEEKKGTVKVPLDVVVEKKKERVVSDIFGDKNPPQPSFEKGGSNLRSPLLPPYGWSSEGRQRGARGDFREDETALESGKTVGWAWEAITKWSLYLLIFLTPLFFLPWGVSPVASNKQFMAIVLVAIALISWLAKTIASGKLVWPKTPLNIAAWILVLVWGVSAYFSVSPSKSFGFMGVEPDNFLNVLTYALAFFLVGAVFSSGRRANADQAPSQYPPYQGGEERRSGAVFGNGGTTRNIDAELLGNENPPFRSPLFQRGERGDLEKAIYVFLASLGILAIFTGLKFLNVNFLPHSASSGQSWEFAKAIDFNPIGTINALGLFLGFGLVLIVSMLVTGSDSRKAVTGRENNALTGVIPGGSVLVTGSDSRKAVTGRENNALTGVIPGGVTPTGSALRTLARNARVVKIGLIALAVIIAVELLLINFRGVWWALAGAMLFLVAFALTREVQDIKAGRKEIIKTQKLVLPIVILAISVILLLVSLPIGNLIAFPAEVSPSNSATYDIAKDAWKDRGGTAEIGSGPATFSYNYGLYRDRAINQTVFWGVKFNQGSSFILTCLSTVGALGFGALIIFLAAFIWQAFRIFGKKENGREDEILEDAGLPAQHLKDAPQDAGHPLKNLNSSLRSEFGAEDFNIPLIAAALFSLIAWFVYPANFSLMMLGFICLGLMMASRGVSSSLRAAEGGAAIPSEHHEIASSFASLTPRNDGKRSDRNDDSLREISLLTSPQRTLIISLILIILMIGSVSVLYLEGQKYIASLYFSSGLNAFNRTGDPDIALDKFVKAINLDASIDQYWRAASQASLIKTSNILNSPAWQGAAAAALEDMRSQFQVNMSQAISFAQRATEADSKESINWTNLGYIYENILLFVNGAEKFLVDSYSKAIDLEPKNPALRVDFGRAHIAVADRLAAQINQISDSKNPDKAQIETLTAQYKEELLAATKELEKAVDLKPDYSPAHFLLVQASTREGDLKKALAKSIDYFNLNQKDPGAAFQLGFLYYKDIQMDNAKAALEWAVALNESYSNARYFLGLIYDAQGNKKAAKEQFEKIAALNPDNEEVKKILTNLNANKPALETIVPPAPAPEQRTQTPVQETGGAQQPLQP